MKIIAIVLVALCLSACGGSSGGSSFSPISTAVAEPAPAETASPAGIRVEFDRYVIVGDSIMALSPASLTTAALMLMEEDKPATNISRSGQAMSSANADGVAGAINYLTAHGTGEDNVAVIVELAHNGWFRSSGLDVYYTDYVAFLDGVIDEGEKNIHRFCVVPIASLWDFDYRVNELNESYADLRDTVRQVAATGKCELIETGDWYTESEVFDTTTFLDGLHLGPAGHRIYKDRLMEVLNAYTTPELSAN